MLWAVIKKRLPIHYFTLFISICMFPVGLALNAGPATIPLVIAPIAIDFFSSRPGKDFIWAAKVAIVVYYIGIALNIISPDILEMLVANFRTSPLRGFNSFTSEPSYLGLVALCLTAILIALKAPRKWGGGDCFGLSIRIRHRDSTIVRLSGIIIPERKNAAFVPVIPVGGMVVDFLYCNNRHTAWVTCLYFPEFSAVDFSRCQPVQPDNPGVRPYHCSFSGFFHPS